MNRKNLLLISLALLLVFIGNRLSEEGVKQVDRRLAPRQAVELDYFMNDFTISQLDETGQLKHRLQATQLNHFSAEEPTRLEQPQLEVFDGDRVVWRINAEQGEINQQQDEVVLQGAVRLRQQRRDGTLQLATSQLRIQPGEGRADTDQAVTLTRGASRIDAVGMQLEQEGRRLVLLSQVRGYYEAATP